MNLHLASLLRVLLVGPAVAACLCAPAAARSAPAAAAPTLEACSWDRPGNDPFMGDVVAAVDRYQDIAVDVRARLKARMVKRDYDDVVSIRRDSITGKATKVRYGSAIRDMHFGSSKLCRTVSRSAWSAQMQERGLVYCDSGHCILVPTVCRNVSRIARAEVANERAEGEGPEVAAPPVAMLDFVPTPIDAEAAPTSFALAGVPGAEAPPDGYGPFGSGGGGGGSGGGFGSFASGGGGASGLAAIASSGGGGGEGFAPPTAPPGSDVIGTITPVPEPETWGLMLGGIAALAAWSRRRR